jgi:hypothetical protein
LKVTIIEFATTDDVKPELGEHGLLQLWKQLCGYLKRWGVPADDDWGKHCHKLISHMHEADPDGERYRYPADRKGKPFETTSVEIEKLVEAHWHITTYCEGSASMHDAGYRG